MTTIALSPVFSSGVQFDSNGNPLAGGKLYAYVAGSNSTLKTTYDFNGVAPVSNANPITLNSSGRLPVSLWLISGEPYNLVLTESDGTTVIEAIDNVRTGTYTF